MKESKKIYELKDGVSGIIVSDLNVKTAATDKPYCHFQLKVDNGKFPDYITVKTWGDLSLGVSQLFNKAEPIEVFGSFEPFIRKRKIKILDENDNELNAKMTEEVDGSITLRLTSKANNPIEIKQCERYILCSSFAKIENKE